MLATIWQVQTREGVTKLKLFKPLQVQVLERERREQVSRLEAEVSPLVACYTLHPIHHTRPLYHHPNPTPYTLNCKPAHTQTHARTHVS